MKWLRKVLAHFGHAPRVAKPEISTPEVIAESRHLRRDLREVRRLEIVVRRR